VIRYKAGDTALGGIIDLREAGNFPRGRSGDGTVHHIAFRAASDAAQAEMVRKLAQTHGIPATGQKNRDYLGRSTSASRTGSCLRSPRTTQASPSTSRPRASAKP
jgi:glyoxalase family protein